MENDMENKGLSAAEAEARLEQYGPNDVPENEAGFWRKFLVPLYSPISLMLLGAAFLSRISGKIFDFYFILALWAVNYLIQKWQEWKADKAIKELQSKLSFDVWTLRDGRWIFVNARYLVRGDRVRLGLGSIIPADAAVVSSENLTVNEAVLTGESLPKDKKSGDKIYSGAFIATGNLEAEITATGKDTYFGKTIFSIEPQTQKSILEQDILSITRFLTIISLVAVAILTAVFAYKGFQFEDLLTLDLSLVIAGIPIALPAVMAIILSIGAAGLARKFVIVRRLSALQDLANVNMLLTDKTGTLTKNEIKVSNVISYKKGLSTKNVIEFAGYATSKATPDAIDLAIAEKMKETTQAVDRGKIIKYVPYDSDRKRSTVLVRNGQNEILVSMGAPQIISSFVEFGSKKEEDKFQQDITDAAAGGFRVLALAVNENGKDEKRMEMAGLIYLSDPLDESSGETIRFMQQNGIDVKMLTGDNRVIAARVAEELNLSGRVLSGEEMKSFYEIKSGRETNISAFAEVMPKDKYEIVRAFKESHIVAVTGDGVNDLPALKVANVGIAVSGAVTALKSLADIVLLGRGLAVIKDAILESRKIFIRLYNYSVYRISESFRLIITILILGLWYGSYPLVPIQLILLAFLNDIPIISLAVDRVRISAKPSEIKTKERFALSLMFGLTGVMNSLFLFLVMFEILHLPLGFVQTMFFLKLTISGHSLIFVAHTKERWYKFLPSKEVIMATVGTQIVATAMATTGFLMPSRISFAAALFVWLWALVWMQISELMKDLHGKMFGL